MSVSEWIRRFSPLLPNQGNILDLACGKGRHGRFFLEYLQANIHFLDRDTSGLVDLIDHPRAIIIEHDLEDGSKWPFENNHFTGICVTNYLYRPHLEVLTDSLSENGVLIYETFAEGNARFGKPSNPDFLLKPSELLDVFHRKLHVVAYEHGQVAHKVVQRIIAIKQPRDPSRLQIRP